MYIYPLEETLELEYNRNYENLKEKVKRKLGTTEEQIIEARGENFDPDFFKDFLHIDSGDRKCCKCGGGIWSGIKHDTLDECIKYLNTKISLLIHQCEVLQKEKEING